MKKNKLHKAACLVLITVHLSWLPLMAKITIEDKIACKAAAYNFAQTAGNSECSSWYLAKEMSRTTKSTKPKDGIREIEKCTLYEFLVQYSDCLFNYPNIGELTKERIDRLKEETFKYAYSEDLGLKTKK